MSGWTLGLGECRVMVTDHWTPVCFFLCLGSTVYVRSWVSVFTQCNIACNWFTVAWTHTTTLQEIMGSVEGRRVCAVPISLRFFKLLGIHWNLACQLFLCQKMSLCIFSTSGETRLQTRTWKSTHPSPPPPPPPSSNGVKYTLAQCFSSQRTKSYNVWRRTQGEGGAFSLNLVNIFVPSWKKNRTFFNTKRISMPNFSGFQATWKVTTK